MPGRTEEGGSIIEQQEAVCRPLCIECGYDLRNLDSESVCPECHTPVRHSQPNPVFAWAHPRWVKTVCRGLTLFAWGMVIAPVFLAVSLPVIIYFRRDLSISSLWWVPRVAFQDGGATLVACIAFHGYYAFWAVAAWLVAAQEPRLRFVERPASARRMVRLVVLLFVPVWSLPWFTMGAVARDVHSWFLLVALSYYIHGLSSRVTDTSLSRRVKHVAIGLAVTSVLMKILPDIFPTGWWHGPGPASIEDLLGAVVLFAFIFFYFSYAGMLFEFRRILRRAQNQ